MRLTKAIINTKYLKKNFLNIRKKASNRKVMAVVKADAYGHGIKTVVNTFKFIWETKTGIFCCCYC